MPQLSANITTPDQLERTTRTEMYDLYAQFYDSTSQEMFDNDLNNKTHVLLLQDNRKRVRGFTCIARYPHTFNGDPCQIVYSGDTIIHQDFWGEQTLPEAWIELTGNFKSEYPTLPLFWFLIVKGYRTYRYLSIFSRQYYPHHQETTPADIQTLLNELASNRFPDHYNAQSGLIQFPKSRGHLGNTVSGIPDNALKRREVQFFLERNPRYTNGDELVCITELSVDNLSRRARVYFEKGLGAC